MTAGRSGSLVSMVDHRLGAVVTFPVDDIQVPRPRSTDDATTPDDDEGSRTTALVVEVERRPGSVLMIRHHEIGTSRELAMLIQAATDAAGAPRLERLRAARTTSRFGSDDAVPERRFLRALGSQLRPGMFALVILCSARDSAALHRVMARTHPDVAKVSLGIQQQDWAVRRLRTSGLVGLLS